MEWIDLAPGQEPMEVSFKQGNETTGCIKYWEILE
jgi:hypothetical protein